MSWVFLQTFAAIFAQRFCWIVEGKNKPGNANVQVLFIDTANKCYLPEHPLFIHIVLHYSLL